jgi:TolA-binding protein
MTRSACGAAAALLFLGLAVPAQAQQYYLYTPKAVTSAEAVPPREEGVLVREVAVRKGDTLARLSKKFSGRASYYPQILLFNRINNPNLIYAGDTLRIPVSKGQYPGQKAEAPAGDAGAVAPPAPGEEKPSPAAPVKQQRAVKKSRQKHHQGKAHHRKAGRTPSAGTSVSAQTKKTAPSEPAAAQKLFERAMKAYRQDDCRAALELFDRFLADYPASLLAADASLYKAECYLKLSGQ